MDIYLEAQKHGWEYNGDANLTNYGYFYKLDDFDNGFVEAINVTVYTGEKVWVDVGCINIEGPVTDEMFRDVFGDMEIDDDNRKQMTVEYWQTQLGIEYGGYGGDCFDIKESPFGDLMVDGDRVYRLEDLEEYFFCAFIDGYEKEIDPLPPIVLEMADADEAWNEAEELEEYTTPEWIEEDYGQYRYLGQVTTAYNKYDMELLIENLPDYIIYHPDEGDGCVTHFYVYTDDESKADTWEWIDE